MLKNASTATKAFVFVAPLRFPRDPFLFPLPPEFSLVVRYRATQTQRRQTAAKATVVNKKIWFFSKNFSKAYRSITLQYLCQLETSSRRFCDWNKMFRSWTVSTSKGIIINNLISCHRKYITSGIGSFHFTWKKNSKVFRG